MRRRLRRERPLTLHGPEDVPAPPLVSDAVKICVGEHNDGQRTARGEAFAVVQRDTDGIRLLWVAGERESLTPDQAYRLGDALQRAAGVDPPTEEPLP